MYSLWKVYMMENMYAVWKKYAYWKYIWFFQKFILIEKHLLQGRPYKNICFQSSTGWTFFSKWAGWYSNKLFFLFKHL